MAASVTSERRTGLIRYGCKQGPQRQRGQCRQWQPRYRPSHKHDGKQDDKHSGQWQPWHRLPEPQARRQARPTRKVVSGSPGNGQAVSTTASKNHKQGGHRQSWYQPSHRHSYRQGPQAERSVLGQAMLQARTTSRVVNGSRMQEPHVE